MARELKAKFVEVILISLLIMPLVFGTINGAGYAGYTPKPETTTITTLSSVTVTGINQTSGLELTMSVQNTAYTQGQPVPITFTLTNISNQTITLGVAAWSFDFLILNATNNVIYRYATAPVCWPQYIYELILNPGENYPYPPEAWPGNGNSGSPPPPGTYYIIGQFLNVDLNDILVRTPPLQITLTPGPPQVDISPCFTRMDVGQYINFSSIISGITPPYTRQWMLNGASVSGARNPHWTFYPQSAGSYNVSLTVTITTLGFTYTSNIALVCVNPTMSISRISPANVTCLVGQNLTFAENVTGGSAPYTYAWGNGSNYESAFYSISNTEIITNSTTTTYNFTPSSPGNYTIICVVWDTTNGYVTTQWPISTTVVTVSASSTTDPPSSGGGGGGHCYLC